MKVRFVEFAIPFMIIELDGLDLGLEENELFPLIWLIDDLEGIEF